MDLKFPQSGSADPNLVTVTGRPELVDEAIDHLLNLEEEYVRPAALLPCSSCSGSPHFVMADLFTAGVVLVCLFN